jgi:ribosomal protein S18 acetylase RimI-like enzyme
MARFAIRISERLLASEWAIRRAWRTDADALRTLVGDAYRPYIKRIGREPGPMLDDYDVIISQHQVWVVEQNRNIIGGLVLVAKDDHLLLDNIAVHPSFQGSGMGRVLLDLADEEAKRQGYLTIQLYTHEMMVENIAMYMKLGWTEVDRRSVGHYARVYMQKTL